MPLSVSDVRRLALIKHLYLEGIAQSRRPSPLNVAALLAFHDAVELFLALACEHHGKKQAKEFMAYFPLVNEVTPIFQGGMERLNKARVGFKHNGVLPHDDEIESLRSIVAMFFEENTPKLFEGLEFPAVSLVELVTFAGAKAHLVAAENHWATGARVEAVASLALAYDELHWLFMEKNGEPDVGFRPFDLGPSLSFLSGSRAGVNGRMAGFIDKTIDSIQSMRKVLRVMVLGLDFKRYAEFASLTPAVFRAASGNTSLVHRRGRELTQEQYERCHAFVIDAALKFQAFDFVAATPPP